MLAGVAGTLVQVRVRTAAIPAAVVVLLAIPTTATASFLHVVAPGESLTSIAAIDGLTVAELAAANGLPPTAELPAGSQLAIPAQGGELSAQPSTPTASEADGDADSDDGPGDGASEQSSSVPSVATSQPVGAAAEGSPGGPPYPTAEMVSPAQVSTIAAANGVPPSLANAIADEESGFNNGIGVSARVTATARPRFSAPTVRARFPAGPAWQSVAGIDGQSAAWIARRVGVTLVRFDQRLVHLVLHAGSDEPRGHGWRHGDRIGASEIHRVVAAFNGGFKLGYGSVGFQEDGRVGVPLATGLGSVVTYRNGTTDIGAWRQDVPAARLVVASVLQNLRLLVGGGKVAPTVGNCIIVCWGKTVEGRTATARSALGITRDGELVWAAGENLTPTTLAHALVGAGVVRAVELDINPGWVAGFLYVHHSGGPTAVAMVPGQRGIPNRLLRPYRRDFFTIIA